ncbi:nuclear transport factor 2 family protein [Leptospira adleri]|uniref:SnoaL-like domain-containing protein n=1 Tax=Leptospira adleri TaxID=2023186 RepID=A0A2M9YQT0_9LEPT|nr:nuclear transport factor 2 family protein [Leptospira adleri]PJZ53898.1 hypothetical protein CH380_07800 [Leptospira adleri]PJZ63085.1 hypothetical protein CH376_04330 [Leptospira adleri]
MKLSKLIAVVALIVTCGNDNADELQIQSTVEAVFTSVDQRDWEKLQSLLAETIHVDYTSLSGGQPSEIGASEIVDSWKNFLPGFYSTHHQVGNFQIEKKGSDASVKFSGIALHYLPIGKGEKEWVVSGTYEFKLRKTESRTWTIQSMKFNLEHQSGNLKLGSYAISNVKNHEKFSHQAVPFESKMIVSKFFGSLENKNIPEFLNIWNESGIQRMPLSPPNFPKELAGISMIKKQYSGLPDNFSSMKFLYKVFPTETENKVIVQYSGKIALKTGGEYNNNYVGILELKNRKIEKFTEYFDPEILQKAFGRKLFENFSVENGIRKVEFLSQGLKLVGKIHLPPDFDERKKYAGVIVTGSWTTVKEQMPDLYARKLAKEGFVALTFDFRNYGESEGEPRNLEKPNLKIQDIENATKYMQTLSYIDSLNGLAICASSGYLSEALAKGLKLSRVAFVAPWLHDKELAEFVYGGPEGVGKLKEKSDQAEYSYKKSNKVKYVPAVSETDSTAAMFGPFDYYLNEKRGKIREWRNQFAVMGWRDWLEFDPIPSAKKIKTPILMIHSEGAAIPNGARLFYKDLSAEKKFVWVEKATQFDFYDQEPYTSDAVKKVKEWFLK